MSLVLVLTSISTRDLEDALAHPARVAQRLDAELRSTRASEQCILEKTQLAIHVLLTGEEAPTDSPLSAAIFGEHETGLMRPSGPVMYLTADEVRKVANALAKTPREEFGRRYSAERLAEAGIYPNRWLEDPSWRDSVLADYEALVDFYAKAAAEDRAVLIEMG